ncbi:MAG: UvrD-helicase domain-containing protein [Fimbriimonadales bacterium]|nr:UvrD-helicase domain-containing protein [Fimbriimonadales bacterium]
MVHLSEEQRAVVQSGDPRQVVRAAAGSGKTRVLVERFLRLVLEEGLDADSILTITFTKRAAAEMKSRIVRRLVECGRPDQAQLAETGPISTIHSFCERLLRENAVVAGIDPEFEVQEGVEGSRLLRELSRLVVGTAVAEDRGVQELLERLLEAKPHLHEFEAEEEVAHWVREGLRQLRGSGADPAGLLGQSQDPSAWLRTFWKVREATEACEEAFYQALLPTLRKLRPSCSAPSGEDAKRADQEAAEASCALGRMTARLWELYEERLHERGWLDYAGLEALAVSLLERYPEVSERCRERYPVVLVDEAQDLNPVQYRLLELLACEREMLVGDEQQSIYGFRLADKTLFESHASRHGALPLRRNYRSKAGILRFVDDLFAPLWPDRGPMAPKEDSGKTDEPYGGVRFVELASRDWKPLADAVASLRDEGTRLSDIAVLCRKRFQAVAIERALRVRGIDARLFGESEDYYTRLEIRDMANALKALVDPTDKLAFLAFLRGPLVGLSMDSVASFALDGLPTGDWSAWEPPLDEDRDAWERFLAWYPALASFADRLTAWEALKELFARSECLERLAAQRAPLQTLSNVRKLLRLAAEAPHLGPAEFAEQIREIERMRHPEGEAPIFDEDADQVRVMTIHKAKGLEFPVVFVAGLADKPRAPDPLLVDRRSRRLVFAFEQMRAPCFAVTLSELREREREEERRVVYVALTRAQRLLVLCGPKQGAHTDSPWAWMASQRPFREVVARQSQRDR